MSPDDEEAAGLLARLFAALDPVPVDVVPVKRASAEELRAALLAQNAAAGTWGAVAPPAEVLVDVDGAPHGVAPPGEPVLTFRGAAQVTAAEVARAGLTPADLPNLSVWDSTRGSEKE